LLCINFTTQLKERHEESKENGCLEDDTVTGAGLVEVRLALPLDKDKYFTVYFQLLLHIHYLVCYHT